MYLLLFLFNVYIQDTVYVYAHFPYKEELKFIYPSFSEKFSSLDGFNWLITEISSVFIKDYGNLTSLGLRGTRTQDIDIKFNGIPLKTVQNDYADLSLLPSSLGLNVIIIKHPLSSYGTINGAAGGIFFVDEHKEGSGFLLNSLGLFDLYLFSSLWKNKTLLSFSEKKSKEDGFKKAFLFLHNPYSSFLFTVRDARVKGPLGTNITGDKKELFSGYCVTMLNNNSVKSLLSGNFSYLLYRSGSNVDVHKSFYNYAVAKLGMFRFSLSSEYLSSTKSLNRVRNTFSLIGGRDVSYKNIFLTINSSIFLPDGFKKVFSNYFLGASYREKMYVVYLNYSKGVHLPSFFDLYWPEDAFAKGNPNLLPEYISQYEVGFKYLSEYSAVYLTYFNKFISNMIQWILVNNKYTPFNTNSRRICGIELKLIHTLGVVNAGFSGALSFFDGILYYPHVSEGFNLRYKNFNLGVSFIGRREKRPNSIKSLPPMEFVNLDYKKRIGDILFEFGVFNLLDEYVEWITGYPQNGRVFYINIKTRR